MDVGLSLILDDDSDPRVVDLLAALAAWRYMWRIWGPRVGDPPDERNLAAAYDAFMAEADRG